MRVLISKIVPWYPTKVRMQWDLEEVGESGVFNFIVERSGSPGGPWTAISISLPDTYTYDDMLNDAEAANTLSLQRDIYYRIKAIPPSGLLNVVYSPVVNLEGLVEHTMLEEEPGNPARPIPAAQFEANPQVHIYKYPNTRTDVRKRLYKRALMRNMYLMLKRLNGIEFVLLKRRHFGTRCTNCYDPITRTVLITGCPLCYGTSWLGGYFTPLDILGRIVRGSKSEIQTVLSPQTKDDVDFPHIQTLDFPRIDEGDLLVAKGFNRRFLVKQRYNPTLKAVITHQTLSCSELARMAPEYTIPAGI